MISPSLVFGRNNSHHSSKIFKLVNNFEIRISKGFCPDGILARFLRRSPFKLSIKALPGTVGEFK